MIACPETSQLLEILAGNEEDTLAEVLAHVGSCLRCQNEMSQYQSMLEVAGAYEAFETESEGETELQLADRMFHRVTQMYENRVGSDGRPEMRSLAVMFTDMADSTQFAEAAGSMAAYEKRQQHNALILPLIDTHQGILVEVIGDAVLAIFNETANAARCAIAMQRRLADFNQSDEVDTKSLEIHIRAGIHYGKAVVVRKRGRVEVAGRAINVAARVEASGGKQTDQILISEAARTQLLPFKEFAAETASVVEAKGVSDKIRLHKLLWREEEAALWKKKQIEGKSEPQLVLAADSARRFGTTLDEDSNRSSCHGLFVDPRTGQGYAIPVWVKITPGEKPNIRCTTACDPVMLAAGERAIASAFDILPSLGFANVRADEQAIQWWIDPMAVRYQGASLGLAITLATVAAYTGTQIDPETAVTGAVDGKRLVRVTSLSSKWAALCDSGKFKRFVLPSANLIDLPREALHNHRLQIIDVPDVEAAVVDVLGPSLGIAADRFVAATQMPESTGNTDEINVQLWIQTETKRSYTRDISIVPEEDVHTWRIGQKIRFCATVDRDCYLSLVNIGATGNVTVLVPNALRPDSFVRAGQVLSFPGSDDRFQMELKGPPGRERVIAIASNKPLMLNPENFDQSELMVCAQPTTRDISIVADRVSDHLSGRCEIKFYVSAGESPVLPEH